MAIRHLHRAFKAYTKAANAAARIISNTTVSYGVESPYGASDFTGVAKRMLGVKEKELVKAFNKLY